MMRALARYAEANAVVRANLSGVLTQDDFDAMIRADSPAAAWAVLADTTYAGLLPEEPPLDVLAIERCLREATAQRFKHVVRPLSDPARAAALALLARWELDVLQDVLRMWHAKDAGLAALAPKASWAYPIPFQRLAAAETLGEVADLLEPTPYARPIRETLPLYTETRSLFRVEVALEKDHYQRLLAVVARLGRSDAEATRHVIGLEIDLINLAWLSRCTSYHEVEGGLLRELMIPNTSPLSRRLAVAAGSPDNLLALAEEVVSGQLATEEKRQSERDRIALLESLLVQSVAETAVGYLAGFPFRFASFLAYYFLLRVELRNLRMVFAGRAAGAPPDELASRLWTVR
jgi:vacuolar-type H+-ATPase subunit C/Vma6